MATVDWLTTIPFASVRNNLSGTVGCKFTVGASNITVTALQRAVQTGDSQTHNLFITNAAGSAVLATTSVNAALGTPGTFQAAALSFTLVAGTTYFISSMEFNGGDHWFDSNATQVPTAVATMTNAAFGNSSGTSMATSTGANTCYVPVSFQYTVSSNYTSNLSDVFTLVDSLRKGLGRGISETYSLIDLGIKRTFTRVWNEIYSIVETFSHRSPLNLIFNENFHFWDLFNKGPIFPIGYFRQYMLDLRGIRLGIQQATYNLPIVVVEKAMKYYRSYLGKI